jgi:hypothetical protein
MSFGGQQYIIVSIVWWPAIVSIAMILILSEIHILLGIKIKLI